MKFNEIEVGQKAFLEVSYGDTDYELPTAILGKNENALLIQPYKYQGTVLEFEDFKKFHTVFFHLHYIDPQSGKRVAFKNLDMGAIAYNGKVYYKVEPRSFLSKSSISSERRRDRRISLTGYPAIVVDSNSVCSDVELVDISEAGVCFKTAEALNVVRGSFRVGFSDVAGGKSFNLNLNCALVRVVEKDGFKLYGCRYVGVNHKLLPYLYFKHMELDREPVEDI